MSNWTGEAHKLTRQQQKSLHLYLEHVASELNASGWTIQKLLQHTIEIQWSKNTAKELLWRPIQKMLLDKESSKDLKKIEPSEVYDIKKSKEPISKIQRRIWLLCKEIIRTRHGNICYTCGANGLSGSNWHTGHLWAKAILGAYLKYDLRVLRPQCYKCNINHGGRGADFWVNMVRENGQEYMDKLKAERSVTVRAYEHYQSLIPLYEQELKNLLK